MTATTAAFTLYLAALFVLALAAWRKTRNETDYVLGGRSLGPAVAALSAGASDMSGWLLLGLPGAVFLGGLTESWIMIGLMLGAYLNWRFVAARLREATGTGTDRAARSLCQRSSLSGPRAVPGVGEPYAPGHDPDPILLPFTYPQACGWRSAL